MTTPLETVLAAAREFLGDRLTTNLSLREQHSHGADTNPPVLPDAVAFVETTEEVSRLLALCQADARRYAYRHCHASDVDDATIQVPVCQGRSKLIIVISDVISVVIAHDPP